MQEYSVRREVRRVGGVVTFSPSVSIEQQSFCWDTNCFYRRLGVATDATRREIARAYVEIDPKRESLWYSSAAIVLLNKDMRKRYDAVPLGNFWSDDPFLDRENIEAAAAEWDEVVRWGVYADWTVDDDEAMTLAPEWRSMLAIALAPLVAGMGGVPPVGVGVTAGDAQWRQVGLVPVLFLPLDCEPSPEYVLHAAQELVRMATPVVV